MPKWASREAPQLDRTVKLGRIDNGAAQETHVTNRVRTTKYTALTFLPKNLFEQCTRFTNAYFIGLCILMSLGTPHTTLFISPSDYFSTALVLLVLMSFTAGVAAYDDVRRRRADRETNEQPATVVDMSTTVPTYKDTEWQNIQVGDILVLRMEAELAADAVILATGSHGECFVSTTSLDGETNLKAKAAPALSQQALVVFVEGKAKGSRSTEDDEDGARTGISAKYTATPDRVEQDALTKLDRINGHVVAEAPNRSINTFKGQIALGSKSEGLSAENLLLRGTVVKNTPWVLAVVVYTGRETRIVQNSNEVKYKGSTIDGYVNRSVMVVLLVQVVIAALSSLMFVLNESTFSQYWYLTPDHRPFSSYVTLPTFIAYWLTFFILYGNLMPISLLGSMEFINVAQKLFVEKDIKMYDKTMDIAAKARTANLCQEIGQVAYIFSDKTGTLTQNIMELKMVSIGGQLYGSPEGGSGFEGGDEIQKARATNAVTAIDPFLEVLAVCHTVMVQKDESGNKTLEAESPDEKALVEGAARCGWSLVGRTSTSILVQTPIANAARRYEILAVNAFNSDRKRASLIVRDPSGEYQLLAKGADNVMLERCKQGADADCAQLGTFARSGLRTLVLARRTLDRREWNAISTELKAAQQDMTRREARLAALAEAVEVNMQVVGVTGIEDKLQEHVGDTILCVRRAGIKLWVLTGDKLETARNIGFSTRVLSQDMLVLVLERPGEESNMEAVLQDLINRAKEAVQKEVDVGFMVTGAALASIQASGLDKQLLELGKLSSVVIACRVSPSQKSEMVKLVRKGVSPPPVTLAVGDGANDVPMIQQAQVGVAIYGREGRQAVNSSDFAIAQFHFLRRLLLMHGRWNYRRACELILYIYWKNALLTFLLVYYNAHAGWSGVALFSGTLWMTFNFWTTPGICSVAIVDRDLSEEQALEHPGLYDTGRLGLELNLMKIVKMLFSAFAHSIIIWAVMLLTAPGFDSLGKGGYALWGTAVYTGMLVNVTWRLAFVTTTWNTTVIAGQAIGPVAFGVFLWLYGKIDFWIPIFDLKFVTMYGVPQQMVRQCMFWMSLFQMLALAAAVDIFKEFLIFQFLPDRLNLILEEAKKDKSNLKKFEDDNEIKRRAACAAMDEELQLGGLSSQARRQDVPQQARSVQVCLPPASCSCHPFWKRWWRSRDPVAFGPPSSANYSLLSFTPISEKSFQVPLAPSQTPPRDPVESSFDFNHVQRQTSEKNADVPEARQWAWQALRLPKRKGQATNASSRKNAPEESSFWQQSAKSTQVVANGPKALICLSFAGTISLVIALSVLYNGKHMDQVVVQYAGEDSPLFLAEDSETFRADCPALSAGKPVESPCCVVVTPSSRMDGPLQVYYIMDPFYQNHLHYLNSNLWIESWGGAWAAESEAKLRRSFCKPGCTRSTPTGKSLYPCGLHANTFFNDTFIFPGYTINSTGIAWPTDIAKFANPPSYGEDNSTEWLYESYPGVISKEDGAHDEHFITWMRTAGLSYVFNRYGHFAPEGLDANTSVQVCIDVRYPVPDGVRKYVVIAEPTLLGIRNTPLGIFSVTAAGLCYFGAMLTFCVLAQCPREPGRPRYRRSTRLHPFGTWHEESTFFQDRGEE